MLILSFGIMAKKDLYGARKKRGFPSKRRSPSKGGAAKGAPMWSRVFSDELESAGSTFEAIHQIESGLKVAVVDEIASELELPAVAIRQLARISSSTFSRRQNTGVLSSEESDRIYRIRSVIAKATGFFEGNKAAARQWLSTPAPALGGVRPISLLVNDAGVREVEALLGRLEYGVFT
jgi:putative toxin-antitoxin system antitoxin component (TIGR02293 family)